MRLLDSATLELREFSDNEIPHYAILSHTWGPGEVSYDEMLNPDMSIRSKQGYKKIEQFALLVLELGWKWLWVDTCCIRKDSSAELSEAINSMYRWYKNARRCYVHLEDLDSNAWVKTQNKQGALQSCRWLTRGWTLQELIAPSDCHFYSNDWKFLFTKTEWVLQLSMMLGIAQEVLLTCDPSSASVAQRMSWAARRKTTRSEDMAYCLLGVFDVNMPMLYGEGGEKAFIRLQEEIMRTSDDHSLFVWRSEEPSSSSYTGLLARSPRNFIASRNIAAVDTLQDDRPFSSTNKGIFLRLNLMPHHRNIEEPDVYVALLNCRDPGPEGEPVGIYLKRLGHNQYARVDSHLIFNAIEMHLGDLPGASSAEPSQEETGQTFHHDESLIDSPMSPKVSHPLTNIKPTNVIANSTGARSLAARLQGYNPLLSNRSGYVPLVDVSALQRTTNFSSQEFETRGNIERMPSDRGTDYSRWRSTTIPEADDHKLAPILTPVDLYVRQNIRLPAEHFTPRVYGFVVTEFIHISGFKLCDVWPLDSWSPSKKCIRIQPSEREKNSILCYSMPDEPDFGMLAVLLRWDRKTRLFSAGCIQDGSWVMAVPEDERVRRMRQLVDGSTKAETLLKIRGGRQKVKVELELGMRGEEVVIKVAINIK
ncbi:heterokaryon incompatibility protein-domain-containing protein [Xylariales sp. PMI_506]|nr:heterokaryon incompatibility protein-domain-containing protein [Xylariales sp. PMI_506]